MKNLGATGQAVDTKEYLQDIITIEVTESNAEDTIVPRYKMKNSYF